MINKKKKKKIIIKINKLFKKYNNFYIIDIYKYNSSQLFNFRKKCYFNNIKIINIKNTLLKIIFKKKINKISPYLVKNSYIMFSKNINISAKIIKDNKIYFNKSYYPILKVAFINNKLFYGDKNLNLLCYIKSKEDLIKELILNLKKKFNNFIFLNFNYKIINFLKLIEILKNKKNEKIK
ncbi:MAG: 50S ribosomal protein L10 [Candidatus Shikimatogenerans bostrichidophilus]|nr:MAG: 50S ribosomal protein L10 [Candidatus Shikimatogenerans bostrichidophilus]